MLTNIVDLYYLSGNKVILFKYDWWDVINIGKGIKKDEYGFTCLNFKCTICIDEPYLYLHLKQNKYFMFKIQMRKIGTLL